MNKDLRLLLDTVWEHDLPLGPYGDFEVRQRAQRAWEESLTVDDCLALLSWIQRPSLPPEWPSSRRDWLPGLTNAAAGHVGRAGRRLGDSRICGRLIEMLELSECRSYALESLVELGDPAAFDAVLQWLGDISERMNVCIILAESATPDQVDRLRALAASAPTFNIREAAASVVWEYEAHRE